MSAQLILASVVLAAEAKPGSPPPITFVVTALFAIAIFFLGFDLVRRLRRNRFREEIRDNLAAELAERDAATEHPSGPAAGASDAPDPGETTRGRDDASGKA